MTNMFNDIKIDAKLLEMFFEQSFNSIVITTPELDLPGPQFLYVNPAFTKMSGYSKEEIIGKTPRILQGEKTNKKTIERLKENLKNGENFLGATTNYSKYGKEYHVEWNITAIKDENDKIIYFFSIQKDMSALKKMVTHLKEISVNYINHLINLKKSLPNNPVIENYFTENKSSLILAIGKSQKIYDDSLNEFQNERNAKDDFEFIDFEADGDLAHSQEARKAIDAQSFLNSHGSDINDDVKELQRVIEEIKDSLDILGSLKDKNKELLKLSGYFAKCANLIFYFGEFNEIVIRLSELAHALAKLDTDSSNDTVTLLISSMTNDIETWLYSIFIDQTASDIHYLDASIATSCRQFIMMLPKTDVACRVTS